MDVLLGEPVDRLAAHVRDAEDGHRVPGVADRLSHLGSEGELAVDDGLAILPPDDRRVRGASRDRDRALGGLREGKAHEALVAPLPEAHRLDAAALRDEEGAEVP
ncbi:hypothetical protein D3C72_2166260 [compost metagenome]